MTDLKKNTRRLYTLLRRSLLIITIAGLMVTILSLTGPVTWATPGQSPGRQTVPPPPPGEGPEPEPTPAVLSCEDCLRKRIGPEGGEIDVPANGILVTVPPGSLTEEIEFELCSVECLIDCGGCELMEGLMCCACGMRFSLEGWFVESGQKVPHDYRFVTPIGVAIGYTDADLTEVGGDPNNFKLAYCDETTGGWVPLETKLDVKNRNASAPVEHLTWFGLMCCEPVIELPETGEEEMGWGWSLAFLGVLLLLAGGLLYTRTRAGKAP